MRRPDLLSFLLACATLQPAAVRAQAPPDSACSYSQCALRVEHRFLSTRLVRGASGESVARLGWFGSGVGRWQMEEIAGRLTPVAESQPASDRDI